MVAAISSTVVLPFVIVIVLFYLYTLKASPSTKKVEKARRFGVTQVHPDRNDLIATRAKEIDIYVLHGLNARSDKTFLAWKVDGEPGSGTINWLSDPNMLPAKMPQARIMTYDWNANYDKNASQETMLQHADTLLLKVFIDRKELGRLQHPVIFIASCFGGILLSAAVARSLEAQHHYYAVNRQTFDCCLGIVFLGTPFRGSWQTGTEVAKKSIEISKNAKPEEGVRYAMELVQYLKLGTPDTPSPLDTTVHRFTEGVNNPLYRIPCAFLGETQPTDFAAFWSRIPQDNNEDISQKHGKGVAVPMESAAPSGSDRSAQDVRHNLLHKYNNPDNATFQSLCVKLERFVKQAEMTRSLREAARLAEMKIANPKYDNIQRKTKYSEKFLFPGINDRYVQLQQATVTPGTCQWLFKHNKFLAWDVQDAGILTRTLFICGKGGSGKSTLMNAALNRSKDGTSDTNSIQLYYFFHAAKSDFPQNTIQGLYRSLISQLLEVMPTSSELLALLQEWDPMDEALESQLDDIDFLKSKLSGLFACLGGQKVQVFVDALDECEKGKKGSTCHIEDMLKYLQDWQRRVARLSFLYSIRDFARLEPCVSASSIQITDYTKPDIVRHLDHTLSYHDRPLLRSGLKHVLLERSSNVFLWIDLVVSPVNRLKNSGYTREELGQAIEGFPDEMEGLYRQFLGNLSAESRSEVLILFQLVQVSMRPMDLFELRSALECARGSEDSPLYFGRSAEAFEDRLRSLCHGFLELHHEKEPYSEFDDGFGDFQSDTDRNSLDEDRGRNEAKPETTRLVLRFSHETARDFLSKYTWDGLLEEESTSTIELRAHREVAMLCMRAVSQAMDNGGKGPAFLSYALRFWTAHARKANAIIDDDFEQPRFVTRCTRMQKKVVSLFKEHCLDIRSAYYLQRTDVTLQHQLPSDSNMLMLLAFEGYWALVAKHGVTCRHEACRGSDATVYAAFTLAVRRGCQKTAQTVIDVALQRSIKLDPTRKSDLINGPSPLQTVCQHGWRGVSKIVLNLEWKASSPTAGLCFILALKRGDRNLAERFIDRTRNDIVTLLSTSFTQGLTAAHAAAASGSPLILEILLDEMDENGIDVVEILNRKTDKGYTVLDIAKKLQRGGSHSGTKGQNFETVIEY